MRTILIIIALATIPAIIAMILIWPKTKETPVDNTGSQSISEKTGESPASPSAGLANPASVNCETQGGKVEIITAADGSQSGLCRFDNGNSCEEWAFMNHKCFKEAPLITIDKKANYTAVLNTSEGEMEIELFADNNPITVNNFVFLASEGFYNNVIFHRIIKDFMVQTGDPEGTGMGGPGYKFNDEVPIIGAYERGIVAMANAGPNTNGSQFFIMTQSTELPKNYVIFGRITTGLDILDKIAATPVTLSDNGENSKPIEPPVIASITILKDQ